MFNKTERLLAFRYLRSRKKTGFVSVIAGFSFLGIMLGVATLIIVTSVMNGFKAELLTRILGFNGALGIYPNYGANMPLDEEMAKNVASIKGVSAVVPVLDGQAMITAEDNQSGIMVRGIRQTDLASTTRPNLT